MRTKIESVEITLLQIPLGRTLYGSTYTIDRRCTVLLELRLSNGLVTRTHTGDERERAPEVAERIRDMVPLLTGHALEELGSVWATLMHGSKEMGYSQSRIDAYMQALAAVDTAVWNALAHCARLPLYALWGGTPRALPAVCIGGYYPSRDAPLPEVVERVIIEAGEMRAAGFGGMKLKVGELSPADDLVRLKAVREAVGPDFLIACDANRAWTFDEALVFARGAAEHDVTWFEEPVVWYDQYRGMAALNRLGLIPVCAGQSEISPHGMFALFEHGCVDIMNFDASVGGGPTAWRMAAHAGLARGAHFTHHEEPQQAIQLLNSIPNALCVEFFQPDRDPMWWTVCRSRHLIQDGMVTPSDDPGTGIEYDDDLIKAYSR